MAQGISLVDWLKENTIDVKAGNIGDVTGGDYTEVSEDGTPRYRGAASAWKDMLGDLFGKRLLSVTGKVDYDYENNCIAFSSGGDISNANDRVGANIEINHEMLIGNSIIFYPHAHWFQEIVSNSPDVLDSTEYELTVRWRLIRNGRGVNLTTPDWNTLTITAATSDDVFDTTNTNGEEYMAQITRTNEPITVDCGISDTFQIQVARTDTNGGIMNVFFLDIHGNVDSNGSEEEITKQV